MSDFMRCTMLDPQLAISPASIAGNKRRVTIVFEAATENVDFVDATYEILGESAWQFGRPTLVDLHQKKSAGVAFRRFSQLPANNKYSLSIVVERLGTTAELEAALKLAVSVVGFGKGFQWKLPPVHAIGSIALLSSGLTQLMGESKAPTEAGKKAFRTKALQFIEAKKNDPALKSALGENFADFANLPDETILNAIMGETNSQASTLEALGPVIDHFRETNTLQGLLGSFKPADFTGREFTGVLSNLAERALGG